MAVTVLQILTTTNWWWHFNSFSLFTLHLHFQSAFQLWASASLDYNSKGAFMKWTRRIAAEDPRVKICSLSLKRISLDIVELCPGESGYYVLLSEDHHRFHNHSHPKDIKNIIPSALYFWSSWGWKCCDSNYGKNIYPILLPPMKQGTWLHLD